MKMRASAKHLLLLLLSLGPASAMAQGEPNWLVDTLYGSGKINTVIAVVTVILLGLFLWLFRQDRRISRLENHHQK
jgi:type IV secretory pathway VirB2 component (pilin)